MYTIKNTTGGCGVKGASGAGIAPPGNPGDILYLVSSGVAGAAANVLYTGDGNLYAANSVTTTNVFATRYYGDGGLLSNISSSAITQPFANLVVSNSVTTTNVFATQYYGDGGLLSNISSSAITQPFANLVVSNSVTTTNIFALSANLLVANIANIYTTNIVGFIGSQWTTGTGNVYYLDGVGIGTGSVTSNLTVEGNVFVSNSVTTTNVFATRYYGDGGLLSNISSSAITQPFANLVVSNSVTTTNIFATSANIATMNVGYLTVNSAVVYGTSTLNVYGTSNLTNVTVMDTFNVNGSMTANAANATFFFDTFTIPYINTQDLNVSSVMNFTGPLATISNLYVPGAANIEYLSVSNLAVTGNLYITATNVETTNALTINNSGTMTALMVTQNETSLHTHNVAEFWDATTLAMVIDPRGNVGIHTTVSPGYALTVTDPANFETLYIRGKTGTASLNVTGNIIASNAVTTTNVFATQYYGDGGLLSNVFVQPFANLVVSNSVTTTNLFTTTANVGTLNVWQVSNLSSLSLSNNLYAANAVTTTNVFATQYYGDGGLLSNISSSAITQPFANLVVSNSVTTTNLFATTANVGTLNVWQVSNLSSLSLSNNLYAANSVTTTNLFATTANIGTLYTTQVFGTSQGVLYTYSAATTALPTAFSSGTAGPSISGYHINLSGFAAESAQSVTQFSASTGLLKFNTTGLYQITCVFVADQPVAKVAIGKTTAYTTWSAVQTNITSATAGYDYVYNYPVGSSPSEVVTLPINVTDISQYYYLDLFLSTVAGTPSVLYPTRSTTAVGTAYGTYVQVSPFGNYLTNASGIASALLCNCAPTSNLSGVYSSNAYRIALTTSNGWTVNGTSTSLAVTANGNFQVNQSGIYEVNMCLNTVGNTPVQFQIGSLSSDSLAPGGTNPQYLYTYAPMYTQDPTTVIQLPLNITNISNVYFVECSFPGTVTGNVALNATSTFVSIKPIGGYINTGTNPWTQQGTSVYYNGGPVGIGGVIPTSLTETLTVNGNTSFVSNVTVTSDASGSSYVLARRVPTGSLDVTKYVTGSVPLTTTTNLIRNYLSNAATVSATGIGGFGPTIYYPGTANSRVVIPYQTSVMRPASNLFMEAWVYLGSTSAPSTFAVLTSENTAGGSDDFSIRFLGNPINSVQFYIYNTLNSAAGTPSATYSFPVGWVYVAASYNATAGTSYIFYCVSGTSTVSTAGTLAGTQRVTAGNNLYIGSRQAAGTDLNGHIYDARIIRGGVVPTGTYTINSSTPYLFSSAPTYRTGMDTGYTSNLTLALQSQYFPGASTSPYGPVLTLPGTVGSYYSSTPSAALCTAFNATGGFTLETWVNFASFANSNLNASGTAYPYMITNGNANAVGANWAFGATVTGNVAFNWWGGGNYGVITANTMTTGQWTHLLVTATTTTVSIAINGMFSALAGQGYTPTSGNNGTTPTIAPSTVTSPFTGYPISLGQWNNTQGPNYAIAKARLVYGAQLYSVATFTPSPNFITSATVPVWQLESQYPLPTYPSFFDVPVLPQQTPAYGAEPTPVGGVTSNVLGPYSTTYPQLDSIRFDGTGYIDYGNAASSVLTTNLWANAWTIEAWVYPTAQGAGNFILARQTAAALFDLQLYMTNGTPSYLFMAYGNGNYSGGINVAVSYNTWNHVAAVYNGTQVSLYTNGSTNYSFTPITASLTFTPTHSVQLGYYSGVAYLNGNLADVRVSNVARYTGSTYTVPTAPFVADSSTLLLLKSLAGQVGTTLEIQGRGTQSVSLGATQTVRAYPPAPMSSYLLDTTSNASVTYGQGKYIASASSEDVPNTMWAWNVFRKQTASEASLTIWKSGSGAYNASGNFTGSITTVDVLGNGYAGEWLQIQMPISVILSTYVLTSPTDVSQHVPKQWSLLGSRDGTNWTLIHSQVNQGAWTLGSSITNTVSSTQAFTFYRIVVQATNGGGPANTEIAQWTLNGTEEALCVTSDSKVGVGIANPQRALEVAGDLVVSGTISGGAGMGAFRNRIINGDMRIAQRGTSNLVSSTSGANYYMIDRFDLNSTITTGVVTQFQSALAVSETPYQIGFRNYMNVYVNTACTNFTFVNPIQFIEAYNMTDLNWGTSFGSPVTLSFWFRSNLSTGSVFCAALMNYSANYSYSIPFTIVQNTWQYWTFTVPPPPNGSTWNTGSSGFLDVFIGTYQTAGGGLTRTPNQWNAANSPTSTSAAVWPLLAGNFINFTGVQLEKGTVATGFEQRPFAQELALCQRYYYQVSGGGNFAVLGTGFATSATAVIGTVPIPPMRASPSTFFCSQGSAAYPNGTIIQGTTASNNDIYGYFAGSNFNFTTVSTSPGALVPPGTRAATIQLSGGAGGLTAGWAGALVIPSTAGKYWAISAEL